MKEIVKRAFITACAGYSSDRVVADPELNEVFLNECLRLGLKQPPSKLNKSLLNLRKSGGLRGIKARRTSFRDQADYVFASEIAMRYLERRNSVTLDDVLCDRKLAEQFDELAARIVPGYSPLRYRWAAFSLRKNRRLRPEPLAVAIEPTRIEQFKVSGMEVERIPDSQGLYLFFEGKKYLYIGESGNLQKRIRKHLEFSDNRGLAYWLWEHGTSDFFLEIQILEPSVSTRIRKAMELELIRSRSPEFNILGMT